jgi:hypothetical protein
VLLVVIGVLSYLLTGSHPNTATSQRVTAAATASASSSGTATAPSPPIDVTAVEVTGSTAQISWQNTESANTYTDVVISPGGGQGLRTLPFPNHSPQLYAGLKPGQSYCFAVGYVYAVTGKEAKTSYSAVTRKACINGGVPQQGAPAVSNVKISGDGAALDVTAVVTGSGATTCKVTVNGGATVSGDCDGTITARVAMYDTSYTVTYAAADAAGTATATASGTSGLKALTANATYAYGTCPGVSKYCGGDSNMEPTPNFVPGNGAPGVPEGTQETAGCWTTGGVDHGTVAYTSGSNQWVQIPGQGYMSILWFPNPDSVTSGLPSC